MSSKFLKTLAVAAGTGIALGVGAGLRQIRRPVYRRDEILRLEPLLDRLELLEAQVASFPGKDVDQITGPITSLEARLRKTEEFSSQTAAEFDTKLASFRAEIPALVDRGIGARMEQLRASLRQELEQHHSQALERFETAIEERLSGRIRNVENTLTRHSGVLETVRDQTAETDVNLQKLIGAVQILVDQSLGTDPASAMDGAPRVVRPLEPVPVKDVQITTREEAVRSADEDFLDLPFQAHLEQAIVNGRDNSRSRADAEGRRIPVAPLMMFAFMIGSRLFR